MTDFVDPTTIAQIEGAKDELIAEVAKISNNSDTIQQYLNNLPDSAIGEAPADGKTYGRKDKTWVEVTGGGGGGDAVWGGITGNLSDQTDLQNALNAKADQSALDAKANTADLAQVATSGSYNDLSGKPAILPDAPADGEQYARINNAWAKVEAELAANPTLQGKLTLQEANEDFVIEQDSSYVYFSRLGVFDGTYDFRFRVGNTGLEFSTNDSGNTWTPVGGGGESEPTNLGNTSTSTSVTITSSTGNNTTVSGASSFSAGVMTAADKSKLDSLEGFSGTYTGDLTVRTNTDNYTVLKPTSGSSNQFITKFQAWGKFNNPFGDGEHQYDVTFKKDGVYHQDVKGSGAERRLAFVDELGGGSVTAADVSVAATPTNYTASTSDVEAHLAGIDTALANAGGGGSVGVDYSLEWFEDDTAMTGTTWTITSTQYTNWKNRQVVLRPASFGSTGVSIPLISNNIPADYAVGDGFDLMITRYDWGTNITSFPFTRPTNFNGSFRQNFTISSTSHPLPTWGALMNGIVLKIRVSKTTGDGKQWLLHAIEYY